MRTTRSLVLAVALAGACAHVPDEKERDAARIHFDLGANALQAGRIQEAMREFLESVRLDPEFAPAHDALGTLYHWSYGRRAEAKAEFARAIELRPNFSEAHNNLGVLLADEGDLAGAKASFERALANPLYATPWIAQTNLGWAVYRLGQVGEGEQLIRSSIAVRPEYCMGHKQLAQLLDATKRATEAEGSWREFAKRCPDEPEALLRLASLQVKSGQLGEGSRSLLRCVQRAGGRPIAADCRAALAQLPPLPAEEPGAAGEQGDATDAGRSVGGSRDLGTVP